MRLEPTADTPEVVTPKVVNEQRDEAHRELERWLAGDHTSNHLYRG